jgi:dTDP-4-amino-4,6-dideoxygalactose transaminase
MTGFDIFLSPPTITGKEIERLRETLESGWLAPAGPAIDEFEARLRRITGFSHAVAVASGTAALHLILAGLRPPPGSAVWSSTLTFMGGIGPAHHMGLALKFFDVSPGSWTVDPALVARELDAHAASGQLPFALIATDLYGQPCDMDELAAACARHGVHLLADSAEALGADYKGRHAGKGARAAVLSFNGNKIVSTGGGGAVLTDDEYLAQRVKYLSTQAREPVPWYEHVEVGFNYRMSALAAAAGLGQLDHLDDFVAKRRANFGAYARAFAGSPQISMMPETRHSASTHWLTTLTFAEPLGWDQVKAAVAALAARRIEARPLWKPMHMQPVFKNSAVVGGAVAESIFERGMCLPSGHALTEARIAEIAGIVLESLDR